METASFLTSDYNKDLLPAWIQQAANKGVPTFKNISRDMLVYPDITVGSVFINDEAAIAWGAKREFHDNLRGQFAELLRIEPYQYPYRKFSLNAPLEFVPPKPSAMVHRSCIHWKAPQDSSDSRTIGPIVGPTTPFFDYVTRASVA